MAVQMLVIRALNLPICLARDDCLPTHTNNLLDYRIGIVGFVRRHRLGSDAFEQIQRLRHIVRLACGQSPARQLAQAFDQCMNFGGQSAARSPERLWARFFGAPAACW